MKTGETVNASLTETGCGSGQPSGRVVSYGVSFVASMQPELGMRVLAMAFDLMLVGLLVVFFMVLGDTRAIPAGQAMKGLLADGIVLLLCVPFLYFVGCWCLFDATPGKMLLSLRIVDARTLGSPRVGQCLSRYMGCLMVVFSLGLGLVGLLANPKAQGWHDRLAGTLVVRR